MQQHDAGHGPDAVRTVLRHGIPFTPEQGVALPDGASHGLGCVLWGFLAAWLFLCFILLNSEPAYSVEHLLENPAHFGKWPLGQQMGVILLPVWFIAPLLGVAHLVRRDYLHYGLDALRTSRVWLSPFDRQALLTWQAGCLVLPIIYLPMYARKRRRLTRIAAYTEEAGAYLTTDEARCIHARQRWPVIALWTFTLGCPVIGLSVLLFIFEALRRLSGW